MYSKHWRTAPSQKMLVPPDSKDLWSFPFFFLFLCQFKQSHMYKQALAHCPSQKTLIPPYSRVFLPLFFFFFFQFRQSQWDYLTPKRATTASGTQNLKYWTKICKPKEVFALQEICYSDVLKPSLYTFPTQQPFFKILLLRRFTTVTIEFL